MRMVFEKSFRGVTGDSWIKQEWMGLQGTDYVLRKGAYASLEGIVYVLERYLSSSVPNQVLNSPSSLLNDACNRTRLQHRADKTTYSQRATLTFALLEF